MESTVGIVTYDRPEHVDRVLGHLPAQRSTPDEVIVVNSGANAETETVVGTHRDRFETQSISLRHHPKTDDTSLQSGRNAVIDESNGDIICFIDDDVVPRKGWLEAVERGYDWDESAVAVGGPAIITDADLTPKYEISRSPANQNHLNGYGEHTQRTYRWVPPAPIRTDFLVGANMTFRADTLEAIGGFDTVYDGQPEFEETDVMARLWKEGETVVYHPNALVYHINASQENSERVFYWYGRNSLRFRRKNFPGTYHRSLVRLLVSPEYGLPVWHQVKRAVLDSDTRYRWQLRGYVDELILDRLGGKVFESLKAPYVER